ncbi:HNH endonuclease [Enterobacter ludwigii]|jgi:hypothetical protein|uniref:HNH endonuclease n=1 Tax=Enterobacter ludwigii TaxID=299767 RepID=UPI0006801B6D|nr:HNH endonuclease signature motif containing protein [Enterobacter ludwigii]UOH53380.1 HNH endonuclease [Enterobacter ludwigii]HDR2687660.1 HNH endonuclease [Enterobacter ludwigii]
MNEVIKPSFRLGNVFDNCVNVKQSEELKLRLRSVRTDILGENELLKAIGEVFTFYAIPRGDGIPPNVTQAEMEDLYSNCFSQSKKVREKYYDKIKLYAKDDICPYCGQRNVSTLDHYLPKSKYPKLVVNPLNLIPCCMECNHIKREHHPTNNEEQVLNPYFDGVIDEIWLIAKVVKKKDKAPIIKFKSVPSDKIQPNLSERINWHFKKFKLANLYTSHASRQLSGIAESLKREWEIGGERGLKMALHEHYISWSKINKNSWQSAMFAALENDPWFVQIGFSLCGELRPLAGLIVNDS